MRKFRFENGNLGKTPEVKSKDNVMLILSMFLDQKLLSTFREKRIQT
jgi:hypothetical protein